MRTHEGSQRPQTHLLLIKIDKQIPETISAGFWERQTFQCTAPSCLFFLFGPDSPPHWPRASWFTRFPVHTQRRTTVGRSPLDEWSARRRDLYLTTHNTHNIHASGGIRSHNLSNRVAADLRLRPRLLEPALLFNIIDRNHERLTKTAFIFIAVDVYI
jgi:hypothetical protein